MVTQEILDVRASAERLFDIATVERAVDVMAAAITAKLHDRNPLLLTVMTGGIVPAAMLLQRLDFPLQVDYIHVTRYGDKTSGGDIDWVRPPPDVAGRTVLLVDDLLDHGVTLQAAVERCLEHGAAAVLTAVLFVKQIENRRGLATTDFHALETSDRYLFGLGMDYKHYWRNGPGVFAVPE